MRVRARLLASVASTSVALLVVGCASDVDPTFDPDERPLDDAPECALADPCPSYAFEESEEGGTPVSVYRARPLFFDPSTCPAAFVSKTTLLEEENGQAVRVLYETDHDGDGVFDNKTRIHRTFVDDEGLVRLVGETQWSDFDGDDVDDQRVHTTYSWNDTTEIDFTYVDIGNDGEVDQTYESTTSLTVAGALRTYHRLEERDLDVDGDIERSYETRSISDDQTGRLLQSTNVVLDEDPAQSSQSETVFISDPARILYRTEMDVGFDGTVDWIELSSSEDASTETGSLSVQRYERDDDADGVVDMITEYRVEISGERTRVTYADDLDADGVSERTYVTDSYFDSLNGVLELQREWRDETGDGVFEKISTVLYDDEGKEARREVAHEVDGILAEATYHPAYCGVRRLDEAP